jgi:hypothetical protein
MRRRVLVATAIVWLLGSGSAAALVDAHACSLDGIPSISANGHLAALNRAPATAKTFLTWSPFVFRQPFRSGAVVRLSEDRALLKGVLSPQGLRGPWRWSFGDGQSGVGSSTISHSYSRPGVYRVTVSAFFPQFKTVGKTKGWLTFDSVGLTVHA